MPHVDPTSPAGVQPNIPGASGYTLIFSDEFSSSTPDPKWRFFRNYADFSQPSNWDMNAGGNSLLRIWPDSGQNYPPMHMDSKGSQGWDTNTTQGSYYGVYECRVKQPRGRGIFPAFWLIDSDLGGLKPELDIYECYGYDANVGWTRGAPDQWRPRNAAATIWYNGGGNQTGGTSFTLNKANECHAAFCSVDLSDCPDLSAAYHYFTLRIAPEGMQMYFDGTPWHCLMPMKWTAAEMAANPVVVTLDLSFREAGLPEPNPTDTPSGPTNSLEFDFVRIWALPGAGGGSANTGPVFNATLTQGPLDGSTLQNTVTWAVGGNQIRNAELVSTATASTTLYGRFTVASNLESASLNLDTTTLANGIYQMRVMAYDVSAGGVGTSTVAMATRTYTINNTTSSDMPILTWIDYEF